MGRAWLATGLLLSTLLVPPATATTTHTILVPEGNGNVTPLLYFASPPPAKAAAQGIDAWVFELPDSALSQSMCLGPLTDHRVTAKFYDSDLAPLDGWSAIDWWRCGEVPPHTTFAVVTCLDGPPGPCEFARA